MPRLARALEERRPRAGPPPTTHVEPGRPSFCARLAVELGPRRCPARACRRGTRRGGRAPPCRARHRRLHRDRVRVVAVVEQRHALAAGAAPGRGCVAGLEVRGRFRDRLRRRARVGGRPRRRPGSSAGSAGRAAAARRRATAPSRRRSKRMPCTVPRQFSAETSQARSRPNQTTWPARALADAPHAAGRRQLRTATPSAPRPSRISALASAMASTEWKNSRWTGATMRDDGHVRAARSADSSRSSPAADMPSSSTAKRCSGRQAQQGEGQAVLVVEVALGLQHRARASRAGAAVISLVVVLPAEPVMAATGIRGLQRARARPRSARAWVVSATRTSGRRRGRRTSRCTIAAAAPRCAGLGHEVVAVEARPRDGHEQLRRARACASRWRRRRRRRPRRRRVPRREAPGHVREASAMPASRSRLLPHRSPAPGGEPRQHVARHLAVVEGDRAVAQRLVGLVALAGDHHGVARAAPSPARAAMASRRSTIAWRSAPRPPFIPRWISSRIASGGSRARVVGGDDHHVGEAGGDRPHQRALGAVAVAAAAEDGDDAARASARARSRAGS